MTPEQLAVVLSQDQSLLTSDALGMIAVVVFAGAQVWMSWEREKVRDTREKSKDAVLSELPVQMAKLETQMDHVVAAVDENKATTNEGKRVVYWAMSRISRLEGHAQLDPLPPPADIPPTMESAGQGD